MAERTVGWHHVVAGARGDWDRLAHKVGPVACSVEFGGRSLDGVVVAEGARGVGGFSGGSASRKLSDAISAGEEVGRVARSHVAFVASVVDVADQG